MTLGKFVGDQGPLRTQVQFYTKAWYNVIPKLGECSEALNGMRSHFVFSQAWLGCLCPNGRIIVIGPSVGMLSPGLGLGPGDVTCLRFLLLNHSEWKKIQRHPESGLQGARNVEENAFGLLLGALAAV